MKKSIFLFLFLTLNIHINYAQNTFSKIVDWPFESASMYDLIVHNDTIVGYGLGKANPLDLFTQGVIIFQTDENGTLLNTSIVTDTTTEDFLSIDRFWGKIVATPNGGYAATTAPFYKNDAWLINLNNNLETEYIKVYEDTINRSNFDYKPFALDNKYILFGSTQGQDYYSDGFISLTDSNGNRQWTSYDVNTQYANRVMDVNLFNDSLLIYGMVNSTNSSSAAIESSRSSLSLIDRSGELQHTWMSASDPEIGYLREVEVEEDGIIMYGQYVADIVNETKLLQSTLSKISRDFSEIYWIRHFGPIKTPISFNGLFKIEPTLDGNYIGAGSIIFTPEGQSEEVRYGWLYKFTSNGELIWELKVPPPASLGEGSCYFYGVGVLPDSSIVAGGTITVNGERNPWLVKVTNDGCLDTLCAEIQTSSPKIIANPSLKLYPNPAKHQLHIELPTQQVAKAVQVFDTQGKLVHYLNLDAVSSQVSLNLPELSNGVYIVEVLTDTGIFREKVFIQQ